MNIGLIGKLGSGKTTGAKYLVSKYGYNHYSLADPMRDIVRQYFDIHDKTDPRYRPLMQKLGTDWFRSVDPDVWVKYLFKRIQNDNHLKMLVDDENTQTIGEPVVVDDVRFLNEAEAMHDKGWLLIYFDAPLDIRRARCLSRDGNFNEEALNHPSETEIDSIVSWMQGAYIRIDSSGTVQEQQESIDNLMKDLLSGASSN